MGKFNYNTPQWRHKSAVIMRRDGFLCQMSKRYGKRVDAEVVHHIYPVEDFPQFAFCSWNLIALSRKKHNELHDRSTNELTEAGLALMRRTKIPDDQKV